MERGGFAQTNEWHLPLPAGYNESEGNAAVSFDQWFRFLLWGKGDSLLLPQLL